MIYSQLVHGLRKFISGCSAVPSNWEMIGFDHRDEVPMVSTLVCMVTHWT